MKKQKQTYKDIIKSIGKKIPSSNCYVYFDEQYAYIITSYCALRATPWYYDNLIAADSSSLPLYECGKKYSYTGKNWVETVGAFERVTKMFDYSLGKNLKRTGLIFQDDKIEARLFVNEENNKIVALDEVLYKAFKKAYLTDWCVTENKIIYIAKREGVTAILLPMHLEALPEVLDEKYKPVH